MKCLVLDCANHTHQGRFIGPLCSPCHTMITTGQLGYGATFVHKLGDRVEELERLVEHYRHGLESIEGDWPCDEHHRARARRVLENAPTNTSNTGDSNG